MKNYWKLGLAVAVVLALAGTAAGIVAAQTGGSTPAATEDKATSTPSGDSSTPNDASGDTTDKDTRRDEYLDALAANLGVSRDALDSALTDTALEMVDKAVADGKITQDEADNIKERINSSEFPPFGFKLGFGHGFEMGFDRGFHIGVKLDDLANFLGVDIATIHEGMKNGQSLGQIAEANGKSRDELKAHLTSNVEEKLSQAVTDGNITQAQADEKLQNFTDNLDEMIDRAGPIFRGGPGFHHRGGPGPFGGYDESEDDGSTPNTETSSLTL